MNKRQVEVGGTYRAKVNGRWTRVRIVRVSALGGWDAFNLDTGYRIRIKTAGRLWPLDRSVADIQKELKRRAYYMQQRGKPA